MGTTNYATAPGAYLQEWMDEHHLTRQHIATALGYSHTQTTNILTGETPITEDTAHDLEHLVGIPTEAWLLYEAAYRTDLARLATEPPPEWPT